MRKIMGLLTVLCLLGGIACWLLPSAETAVKEMDTRQVTDSAGREVMIPKHPKRVVILNASNLDLYVATGGAEDVVGKPVSQALAPNVADAVAKAEEVGIIHSPDVEKILSLKPDLVIGTNVPYHTNLADTLSQAGIPLYVQALDSVEDLKTALTFYGSLTGKEAQAQEVSTKLTFEIEAVKQQAAGRTPPKSLILFGSPESFNMGTAKCFTGNLLNELGGGNIADRAVGDGGYLPLSMEFVARENPQVIFVITHGNAAELESKLRQELAASEAWQNVTAVQTGKVYVLPYDLFAVNPGVRAADAMKVLAKALYP